MAIHIWNFLPLLALRFCESDHIDRGSVFSYLKSKWLLIMNAHGFVASLLFGMVIESIKLAPDIETSCWLP